VTAAKRVRRHLILVWTVVLVGPLVWSVSFGVLFWLTKAVCESGNRMSMGAVAGAGLALVTAGTFLAARIVSNEVVAEDESLSFLAKLAAWGNGIFLLVIGLSTVPIFWLSPCGV
jgi:hypothetical protein